MTRFARAPGSKSSNERVPHEATSWGDMKQSLTARKSDVDDPERKEFLELRDKNYKDFLTENAAKQVHTWAEFGDEAKTPDFIPLAKGSKHKLNTSVEDLSEKHIKKKTKQQKAKLQESEVKKEDDAKITKEKGSNDSTKKKSKTLDENNTANEAPIAKQEKVFAVEKEKLKYESKLLRRARQKERIKERKLILASNEDNRLTQLFKEKLEKRKAKRLKIVLAKKAEREKLQGVSETLTNSENVPKNKSKRRKKNKNITNVKIEESGEHTKNDKISDGLKETEVEELKVTETPEINGDVKIKNKNKKNAKSKVEPTSEITNVEIPENGHKRDIKQQGKNIREHKLKNSKWTAEHRKKPIGPETKILRINGRSIETALFEGFPVRKEDHERLRNLRKEMVSKGIPRSEVNRAMQLERRRAEKALAREKKDVCFNCRKPGHKLTDCPDAMKQETEATGICFKCGSTEHTHFACKVVQQQQFKFATCFICREAGHIAKQCPQNARGIYPQGGCCKVCGDVTHLKKNCPQYQAQQEHYAVQVDTIDGGNLEALEKPEVKANATVASVQKAKVVKF